MNKKLLTGIIAGIIALVVLVVAIVLVTKNISAKKPTDDSDSQKISSVQQAEGNDAESSETDSTVSATQSSSPSTTSKTDSSANTSSNNQISGKTISVPIKITTNPGIAGAQIYFNYDKDALEFTGYDDGDVLPECHVAEKDGKISCVLAVTDVSKDNKKTGNLLVLKFKPTDKAKKGTYELKQTKETMFCNIDEEVVTPKLEIPSITVK